MTDDGGARADARIGSLLELGRWSEARSLVEAQLATRPEDSDLHGWRAQCLIGEGDHTGGLEAANRLVALAPEEEWGHRICAFALERLGMHTEAARAASEAVRLAPDRWQTHVRFAQAAAAVPSRSHEALQAAHEAVRLAPNEPDAHGALAIVAQSRNDYRTARAAYERALALDPEHSAILNNLAMLQGPARFGRAIRGLAQSLRINPHSKVARTNLDSLAMTFPLRLYAGTVVAFVIGLGAVSAGGGPNPASWAVAFLLVVGVGTYGVVTTRQIPRTVRGYFGRRLIGSIGACWNWFICVVGVGLTLATCLLPHGEVIGMIALRPILIGAVITAVMYGVSRART